MEFKIDFPKNVEALVSRLELLPTSSNRLTLPTTKENAYSSLLASLKIEVASRNRKFIMSEAMDVQLQKAAAWLTDPNGRFGLMLGGSCGNGKTTLAKAIRRLLDSAGIKNYNNSNIRVSFKTSKEISLECVNSPEQWHSVCSLPILIIDDLGEEAAEVENFRNTFTPMIDLISIRYDRMLPTIASTNLTPPQILEKYGDRTADRLTEMMECVGFGNPSYRML